VQERIKNGEVSEDEMRKMKVADRYFKLLSRSTIMNTFNSQLESQNNATENLAFTANEKLMKYRKPLMWLGVGTMGAVTGGLAAGGFAVARMAAGGVAAAGVTRLAMPILNGYVENIKRMSDEEFKMTVDSIEQELRTETSSAQQKEEKFEQLLNILGRVDRAKQKRVWAVITLALGAGALAGAGAGQVMGAVGFVPDVPTVDGVPAVSQADGMPGPAGEGLATDTLGEGAVEDNLNDVLNETERFIAANQNSTDGAGLGEVAESVKPLGAYTAQSGETMWDILEGQTNAEKLPFMADVDPDDLQKVLKAVETKLNADPALASEIGFNGDPNKLSIGAEVNLDKLNELAVQANAELGSSGTEGVAPVNEAASVPEAPATEVQAEVPVAESNIGVNEAGAPPATLEGGPAAAMSTHEIVTQYGNEFPGGPNAFEDSFRKDFVYPVEGRPAGGLFSFLSPEPPSVGALDLMQGMDKQTLLTLQSLNGEALSAQLQTHGLSTEQFQAWKTYVDYVVKNDTFAPNTTFGDALKINYINSPSN
jgi:hypothetical protein